MEETLQQQLDKFVDSFAQLVGANDQLRRRFDKCFSLEIDQMASTMLFNNAPSVHISGVALDSLCTLLRQTKERINLKYSKAYVEYIKYRHICFYQYLKAEPDDQDGATNKNDIKNK